MKNRFFLWLVVILIIGCNVSEKKISDGAANEQLTSSLKELFKKVTGNAPRDIKYVLIVPLENSCSSCKQKALEFSGKAINNRKFRVILSSSSETVIKSAKISHFNGNEENAAITERNNMSFTLGLTTVFPVLLLLENDKVINRAELNAENIDEVLSRTLEDLNSM